MNDKRLTIALAICALLLLSFSLEQDSVEIAHSNREIKAKAAPVSTVSVDAYQADKHASDNTQSEVVHSHRQTEFLSPYHWVRYKLNADACKAPDLGKVEDGDSINPFDFFELNIEGDGVSQAFLEKLERRLMLVFRLYGVLIGNENLRRVALNLTVYKQSEDYESYVETIAPERTDSLGIYSHKTISASIRYNNESQAIETSIHESVHAITHALIGATPRWLNEGLAVYFERIGGSLDEPVVSYNAGWVNEDMSLRYDSIDFWQLAGMESVWNNGTRPERLSLYANSWHWLYFFMSSNARVHALQRLIRTERKLPCTVMDESEILELLNTAIPNFEVDFLRWEELPLEQSQGFSFQVTEAK